MNIPRFWSKVEEKVTGPEERGFALRCWGVSAVSAEDAAADARRRLEALKGRLRDGDVPEGLYPYRQAVLREELVSEIEDGSGGVAAIVTRNRYGALVLNAARLPILDVDLGREGLVGRLLSVLFRGGRSLEQRTLDRIRTVLAARAGEGFRIYRTARGFRVVGTTTDLDPRAESTQSLMREIGADRAFAVLCRVQDCFRARLTPKPWRIGVEMPRFAYPLEGDAVAKFTTWLQGYESARAAWSVCRLVEEIGPAPTRTLDRRLVEFHDSACGVTSGLPLA